MAVPPTTTLALADYPQVAGTESSLLGAARFAFGGIAAPLVGLAGALSIDTMNTINGICIRPAASSPAAPMPATIRPMTRVPMT
ncbi:hypothetical protein ACC691_39310, partial [Rhizobium johnstonii]|uniref:hypothetical protein n=1 Tax=Rhizobium johnstonii TaxID=3019933 RepID=UPI003F9B835B